MTTQLRVHCAVLGQTEIRTDGIRLTPEAERQFGMALFFCANAGRDVPRDEVAALFWPEHDTEAARHCLRQALYRLRAVGVSVRSGAKTSKLDERLVEADYATVIAEGASSSVYLALSELAVLPGYAPRFSAPFAEWVEDFRTTLTASLRRGVVRAIADARARGRYGDVDRLARRCLAIDPLNEEATFALSEAVAMAGGKAEALAMIEKYEAEVGRPTQLRLPARILRARVSDLLEREAEAGRRLPLIGREAETEWLLRLYHDVARKEPRWVWLWGDAGIGKTMLVEHFLRIATLRNAARVRVICQSADADRPLSSLCEILNQLLVLPGSLGASPDSLSLLQPLLFYDPRFSSASRDAGTRVVLERRRVFESVTDLVDAVAEECPLLIHLDDAQWLDAETERLLTALVSGSSRRSLLIIACRRSDPQRESMSRLGSGGTTLRTRELRPLSSDAARRLMLAILDESSVSTPAAAIDSLLTLSGGNALFIVELARRIRDHPTETLPANLAALIEERIESRSPLAIALLQACTLLGNHATVRRIEELLQVPTFQLAAVLTELEESALLICDEDRVRCRHEQIEEAVDRKIAQSASVLLRGRVASILERDALESGDPSLLWQSAQHWEASHHYEQAQRVLEHLSTYLLRIGAARKAAEALERAIRYCASDASRVRLIDALLQCYRIAADWKSILETIDTRRRLVRQSADLTICDKSDSLLQFEALFRSAEKKESVLPMVLTELSSNGLDDDRQIALVQMGIIVADNIPDASIAGRLYSTLSRIDASVLSSDRRALAAGLIYHSTFGDLARAVTLGDTIRATAPVLQEADIHEIQRVRWTALPLVYSGRLHSAQEVLTDVLETARRRRLWIEAFEATRALADLSLLRSDLAQAREWCAEACKWVEQSDEELLRSGSLGLRAAVALSEGDLDEAEALLVRASTFFETPRDGRSRARFLSLKLAVQIQLRGCVVAEEEAELRSLLVACLSLGGHDLGVLAVARILSLRGEVESKARLLERYRGSRRETYPVPRYLTEAFLENSADLS